MKPDFHNRFAEYENLDSNLDRPVHGLDLLSVVSDPNVNIDADTAGLSPLGHQRTELSINLKSEISVTTRDLDSRTPAHVLPTPLEVEAATAEAENILLSCFTHVDIFIIRAILSNLVSALDKENRNQASLLWPRCLERPSDSSPANPSIGRSQLIKLESESVSNENYT